MVNIKLCRKPEQCTFCYEKAFALITENPVCHKHLKKISTDLVISSEFEEFVHNYMQERAKNNLYTLHQQTFTRERPQRKKSPLSFYFKKYTSPKRKSSLSPPLQSLTSPQTSRPGSPVETRV